MWKNNLECFAKNFGIHDAVRIFVRIRKSIRNMNINFYLDKPAKNKFCPIHLVIRQKGKQIKIATGEKIFKEDWDTQNQQALSSCEDCLAINKFLLFLKKEVEKHLESNPFGKFSEKELKEKFQLLVQARKENNEICLVSEPDASYQYKKGITFIDLFAGAGGFSEGFLQAEVEEKYYKFLLASDINENCELTHLARYNYQLGLDMGFLRQDITEPDFLDNLINKVEGKSVDVVCGGPPCQSFSLAGKRKKFDKKDDLFAHYLKVIRQLRPKYFVMENVKGILTKEGGKIKEMILQEIRSIVDLQEFHHLLSFTSNLKQHLKQKTFLLECYLLRLQFEKVTDKEEDQLKDRYISNIENKFRQLIPKIFKYKISKTDINISTIRHGFNLLKRASELAYIRKKVINEKSFCDVDNDFFADSFDSFLTSIEPDAIVEKINMAFKNLKPGEQYQQEIDEIIKALEIFDFSFDECVSELREYAKSINKEVEFDSILSEIRLYNIDEPFVALASNYGVPQNRERVLFIGCRKDQKLIKVIPATVKEEDKVTVFEALYDLDFIGNDDEKFNYEPVNLRAKYNGSSEKLGNLIKKRAIDGCKVENGLTYADWSKKGRLNGRFANAKNPFYVRSHEELGLTLSHLVAPLHNHKTSKQNEDVIKRLDLILTEGDYNLSKEKLKEHGLESEKRNYNVLKAEGQSPTVMTISDDYIHYANPRSLTVREMARLQSFDDSFVFQGKRSTGGNKRKYEVPQFTLVGNAVPPLMARAAAMEILKNIQ